MGKQTKSRKQQLRRIQERRQRYVANVPEQKFSFRQFYQNHAIGLFFILFFIAAFFFVYVQKHKHHDTSQIESLTSAVPPKEIKILRNSYPQGFRVFALIKGDIVPLNINTLPKKLTVDWNASKLVNLNRNEIQFTIGRVAYDGKTLATGLPIKIPRREGKASNSVMINDIEITVQLITEYANTGIFFALGFKQS